MPLEVTRTNDVCAASSVVPPRLDIEMVFWTVNLFVLAFLFGERALKNVLSLVKQQKGAQGTA